ncbi:O-antigen ligase family protein, partial [Oleiphilus sp. HI0079]|uniref:O-antigen ligase family protein n=2 Tax=Oleiphilus TaxID=141450 RepID=UPI0018D292D4
VFHSGVIIYSTLFLGFAVFQGDSIKASIVYFGFDNIRFFNQAQVFVLPLLSYLLTVKRIAVAAHLILFANLMLMFVGGGLGIALCWSLMLFALLFFNRRLLVGLLVHTLVAFVSAYGLLNGFQLDEASSVSAQYLSDGGRLPIWLSVIDHLQWRHLLLGIGPGLYSDLSGVSSVGHPHNFLLEMLYEWGAVAVAIALLMVGWTMRLYFVHVYR